MYQTLLFDVDDTILDFHAAEQEAVSAVLRAFGLEPSQPLLEQYSAINLDHWKKLERSEIALEQLLTQRFEVFFETLGQTIQGAEAERIFRRVMDSHAVLIPEAFELLSRWQLDHHLYAISNGLAQTQIRRLTKAGVLPLFRDLFISERIGFNKPHQRFFDYVKEHIPDYAASSYLIIGDSLTSDILGGNRAGIDTCWFNRFGAARPKDVELQPRFELHALRELDPILALGP